MYPPGLQKKLDSGELFLQVAYFCMKSHSKLECMQNKWSDGCPKRRRKQKWHDGEKIYANA